ncbi:MAG: AraC family transcriptional regulator [Dehalococcoidia bacterium]|nr:AraC family transcriptional regulator [Dehalococcoidia bacterium]
MQGFRQRYLREEYTARINKVIDYIESNISKDLSLNELAAVAHFSPFHFHRIFSAMVGETLNGFVKRLRIERAATMLVQNPRKSITEIAFECGFSGSSAFARAFQETFQVSASEWRAGKYSRTSKNGKTGSKEGKQISNIKQDFDVQSSYTDSMTRQTWRVEMKNNKELVTNVEVKDIPDMHVAYIRHIGPYAGDEQLFANLFSRLCAWAGPRGLLSSPETKFITIYHDNPDITEESKLRTDVCISVAPDTQVGGEIGKATIPAGKYAIGHFEIAPDQYGDAWNAVYGGWLPESGYQPDDRPCFELYLNDPKQHPEGKHVVDIYAPVKPM